MVFDREGLEQASGKVTAVDLDSARVADRPTVVVCAPEGAGFELSHRSFLVIFKPLLIQ
jgi:hypothetical protein